MIYAAYVALILSLALLVAAWLKGRPKLWIYPSDILLVGAVIVAGLPPLLNIDLSQENAVHYSYSSDHIAKAIFAISMTFTVFAAIWFVRPKIVAPSLMYGSVISRDNIRFILFLCGAIFAMSLLLVLEPVYLSFKIEVVKFLTGRIAQDEYQLSRRVTFQHDKFIDPLTGRIQYSVESFIFAAIAAILYKNYKLIVSAPILIVYFVLIPAGLAKLTVVVYVGYSAIAYMLATDKTWFLRAKNLIPLIAAGIPLLIGLMAVLYFYQYRDQFVGLEGVPKALSLATFRILAAEYVALVQFFTVYPDVYNFSGLHDSAVYCTFAGCSYRDLNMEVPVYFLGEIGRLTTFPTIFIGAAYGEFGFLGVFGYALVVGIYVCFLDHVIFMIKDRYIRIAYFTVMLINVSFLCQLQALTVMLTYGLGVAPAMALVMDRIKFTRAATARGGARPIGGPPVRLAPAPGVQRPDL